MHIETIIIMWISY